MAKSLYVLFEDAVGYALFQVKEFDEMALLAPRVEECILDLAKFNSLVKTVHFAPFRSAVHALENINCVSEGVVHEDLKVMLVAHVPKSSKSVKVLLGVSDTKLAASIQEHLPISCVADGAVLEILRGIRLHFSNLIKDSRLTEETASKARLGLGHSYSRAKVKFNVHRVDNMIIQSISLLDQLDKDINTFSMRIREWYSYHYPELVKIVSDNYTYARVVLFIKDRKQMPEDLSPLEEMIMDSAKVQAILDSARVSMGMDIAEVDVTNIQYLCQRVIGLSEFRQQLAQYLMGRMKSVAPNLAALIGDQVGARLIAHAGSLTNLAKCPASTVQILGAEKALFRALKTKGNTPKYGLIFHSTFIGRAATKNKGRISRYLANKCSIASRIDCFTDFPSSIFGDHLRQQVEDRLKFFESGDTPTKNIDIMRQALSEFSDFQENESKKKTKKEKKKKQAEENGDVDTTMEEETPKKKKKKKNQENGEETSQAETTMETEGETPKKKKKKKKTQENGDETSQVDTTMETEGETPKKKKKKKKTQENGDETSQVDTTMETEGETPKKKKKKKKTQENGDETSQVDTTMETEGETPKKKKKDKKRKRQDSQNESTVTSESEEETPKKKKKKKKSDDNATGESTGEETPQKKDKKKKRKSSGGD
ncbi:snoRNP complex protein nop56 [Nucella lapillus]